MSATLTTLDEDDRPIALLLSDQDIATLDAALSIACDHWEELAHQEGHPENVVRLFVQQHDAHLRLSERLTAFIEGVED